MADEKIMSNFSDEDDPALISKRFWSHVKSTSKSSRIPGTVNYNGRFRNNPKDQAKLFNEFFKGSSLKLVTTISILTIAMTQTMILNFVLVESVKL